MKQPFVLNPLTQIWRIVDASQVLTHSFPKYIKLVEMEVVHVLGRVENERCFSFLVFLKSSLRTNLDLHLPLVVGM
jgi:hypothetical protein